MRSSTEHARWGPCPQEPERDYYRTLQSTCNDIFIYDRLVVPEGQTGHANSCAGDSMIVSCLQVACTGLKSVSPVRGPLRSAHDSSSRGIRKHRDHVGSREAFFRIEGASRPVRSSMYRTNRPSSSSGHNRSAKPSTTCGITVDYLIESRISRCLRSFNQAIEHPDHSKRAAYTICVRT